MRFFDLTEDLYIPGRWYLDVPVDGRGQEAGSQFFTQGQSASIAEPLGVRLHRPGVPLDFSLADAGAVPIVHARVAAVLRELALDDLQLYPIEVEGQQEPYVLVNVTRLIRCIDDRASSRVAHWSSADDQPERAGEYRNVVGMRIDKAPIGAAKVFRPWGWTIALIVSEEVKDALEHIAATGTRFTEV